MAVAVEGQKRACARFSPHPFSINSDDRLPSHIGSFHPVIVTSRGPVWNQDCSPTVEDPLISRH